jgi:dephospho-CoA kinase
VLSDREKRMKRITERDNLTDNEANLRIEAGKPDSLYKERADFIIYNNGSLENYLNEIEKIFNLIYGGKENG